jgi:large subunit ribosomal protein L32
MSTPTQRHTSSQKKIRRGAIKLKKVKLTVCPKCKKPVRSHKACSGCGTYKGSQVFKVRVPKKFRKKKEKTEKKEEKKKGKK